MGFYSNRSGVILKGENLGINTCTVTKPHEDEGGDQDVCTSRGMPQIASKPPEAIWNDTA